MAIFDAFGAGFDYAPVAFVRKHVSGMEYMSHPKWKGKPGRYTNDTLMAIALAELMIQKDPNTWTHYDVAHAFVTTFRRDPRPGCSWLFYELLQRMRTGWDFLRTIEPFSDKSGGAMRAPVIGLLPDIQQVATMARFQASLTHCTRIGMDAAVASALMTHYFYYRLGPKKDLPWFLDSKGLAMPFVGPWRWPVDSPGSEHVTAAVTALYDNDTMAGLLKACVNFTGDVNTVAAIAGPAAFFCEEIEQDIPTPLIDGLENEGFGRDFLADIGGKLLAKYPRPPISSL